MTTIAEIFGQKIPKPWALKGATAVDCSNPDLMMGVELEIEGCDHSEDWYDANTRGLGWTTTTDNSLRGVNTSTNGNTGVVGNAYEFISKPMKASNLLYSLETFFNVTKFTEENYSDRCSVHVHVNCLDLTPEQVSSVALLYSVVEEILFKFIGENRENNIYCVPWRHCRMNHDMVTTLTDNPDMASRRWQKYTALNLIPLRSHGTVEFRHMHGTSDMKKLTTWINLIGSIFKYGANIQLADLIKEIKTLNSTSEYEVFFARVLANYLPYSDDFRASLEGGIISAKYALINWGKPKKEAKKVSWDDLRAEVASLEDEAPAPAEAFIAQARRVPPPPRQALPRDWTRVSVLNRFIPWPRNGESVEFGTRSARGIVTPEESAFLNSHQMGGRWHVNNLRVGVSQLVVDDQPAADSGILTQRLHDARMAQTARMNAELEQNLEAMRQRRAAQGVPN